LQWEKTKQDVAEGTKPRGDPRRSCAGGDGWRRDPRLYFRY